MMHLLVHIACVPDHLSRLCMLHAVVVNLCNFTICYVARTRG